jgi:hypothetical protein
VFADMPVIISAINSRASCLPTIIPPSRSPELSTELHGALQNQLRVLDGDGYLTGGVGGRVAAHAAHCPRQPPCLKPPPPASRPAGLRCCLLRVLLGCWTLPLPSCPAAACSFQAPPNAELSRPPSIQAATPFLFATSVHAEDWLERVTPQELQAALLPLIQGSLRGDSGGAVAAASLDGNNSGPAVTEQASTLVLYQHVQ